MSKIPVISGKECISALQKLGYYIKRQSGSHIILRRDEPFSQVTVPNHKTLDRGTVYNIIKSTDLSIDDFTHLL